MWISVAQQGDESHKMYADSLASRGRILLMIIVIERVRYYWRSTAFLDGFSTPSHVLAVGDMVR